MYKSRLDKLLDNEEVLKGVLNHDVGVMVYQDEETVSYLILSYENRYVVYLSLLDEYRDILVEGEAKLLADAKELAVEKLEQKMKRNYH